MDQPMPCEYRRGAKGVRHDIAQLSARSSEGGSINPTLHVDTAPALRLTEQPRERGPNPDALDLRVLVVDELHRRGASAYDILHNRHTHSPDKRHITKPMIQEQSTQQQQETTQERKLESLAGDNQH